VKRFLPFAALALAACAAKPPVPTEAPAAQSGHLSLFVSAELKGYLGPCGCSENMRGGIARAAHQLEEARKKGPVLYVDTGDALFGEPSIGEAAVPQQERKAFAMAAALKAMGLSVRARGPLDDARGEAFRKALSLPELPASGVQALEGKVAVVEGSTAAELAARARAARGQGAPFVVGLWRTSFEAALKEAAALGDGGVDLVLAVKAKDELSGEQNKLVRSGAVPLVQLQTKGRSMLHLDLYFHGSGRFELLRGADDVERETAVLSQRIELLRAQTNEPMISDELKGLRQQKLAELISRKDAVESAPVATPAGKNAWTLRFVPLESSFAEDARVKALVTAYDRDVGLLNLKWAKEHGKPCPPAPKGQSSYVGNKECFECHEEAFASWNPSKHAQGLKTLEHVGKQHHLDCIGCHVTGWQQPGGVCGVDQTAGREGVGCESCHGPSSAHVSDPDGTRVLKGNTAEACTGCHDRENSPHFDFDRYLKEIIAPGHGQPAVKAPQPAKQKSG
jgi:predicted CXXCH cytochrome family protein